MITDELNHRARRRQNDEGISQKGLSDYIKKVSEHASRIKPKRNDLIRDAYGFLHFGDLEFRALIHSNPAQRLKPQPGLRVIELVDLKARKQGKAKKKKTKKQAGSSNDIVTIEEIEDEDEDENEDDTAWIDQALTQEKISTLEAQVQQPQDKIVSYRQLADKQRQNNPAWIQSGPTQMPTRRP